MKASKECIAAIQKFEGLRLKTYADIVGVLTIGYGHTSGVKNGQVITKQQADKFLLDDIAGCERYISSIPEINTQGKFDAIVDFCFNLGISKFKSSTLFKYIKEKGSDNDIKNQIKKWCYAVGKVNSGLSNRRKWEADQWEKG